MKENDLLWISPITEVEAEPTMSSWNITMIRAPLVSTNLYCKPSGNLRSFDAELSGMKCRHGSIDLKRIQRWSKISKVCFCYIQLCIAKRLIKRIINLLLDKYSKSYPCQGLETQSRFWYRRQFRNEGSERILIQNKIEVIMALSKEKASLLYMRLMTTR